MDRLNPLHLGRRERQIMEVVYARGKASVSEVLVSLPDPPSYSAVRATLRLLEEKGHLRHRQEGRKFVYAPTVAREKASRLALRNLLRTFFGGSIARAMACLIDLDGERLSPDDLKRLSRMIADAKKEGR